MNEARPVNVTAETHHDFGVLLTVYTDATKAARQDLTGWGVKFQGRTAADAAAWAKTEADADNVTVNAAQGTIACRLRASVEMASLAPGQFSWGVSVTRAADGWVIALAGGSMRVFNGAVR